MKNKMSIPGMHILYQRKNQELFSRFPASEKKAEKNWKKTKNVSFKFI